VLFCVVLLAIDPFLRIARLEILSINGSDREVEGTSKSIRVRPLSVESRTERWRVAERGGGNLLVIGQLGADRERLCALAAHVERLDALRYCE
jgi:hypothetical protein